MSGEFDPTEELKPFSNKIFICNCRGFLTKNNNIRNFCDNMIPNGGHFYDVLIRYDYLISYVLGREEAIMGSSLTWIIPFLKAFGATNHLIHQYSKQCMDLMPSAGRTIRYISNLMPSFIITSMYEHVMMEVSKELGNPLCETFCSTTNLDKIKFDNQESYKLQEMAREISSLKIPEIVYKVNVPMKVDEDDIKIIKTLDHIIQDRMTKTSAMDLMQSTLAITSQRKAYYLLNIRRQSGINLDDVFYIGGEKTDFQSLDLVRNNNGMSISFNGQDFAVRGSIISILSEDSTVGAVFAEQFYNKGVQAVLDLATNWDRKYIKNTDSDMHLIESMLRIHKNKLPEVFIISRKNVDEIAQRSNRFRKNILGA